ncbi:MAG: hypothetical protein IBJ17_22435, partial [Reyranella sp.]|nr:hypothetical protein [Reyranella sp.]
GIAISFCDGIDRGQLKGIERLTNQRIAVVSTPANEDMPAAPPMRPRAEREARDNAEDEQRNGRFRPARPGGGHGRHRSFGDRPSHDRGQHDQSRGDRAPAHAERQFRGGDYRDAPHGERPRGDRPHGDRPRHEGGRAHGHDNGGHHDGPHRADRPQGDRPYGDRPHSDRPHGEPRQPQWKKRRFGGGGAGRGRAA